MKQTEGWIRKRFDEVFDLQMGRTPSRDNKQYWTNGQYKWISIADLKNQKYINSTKECITELAVSESGIKPIPANTVIMSFKLSIGKTAITKESIFSNEAIMAFHLKKGYEIIPEYFYYYLNSYDWGTMNRAVMGQTLNKATISGKRIIIPPITTQQQIVSELDALSDIITKKKQQLEELDKLAQATFYDMFGDPVSNEKGWEVDSINNISKIRIGPFGSLLHVEDYIVNGTPLVNPSHMSNGMIIPDYNLTVSSEKIKELSSYLLKEGDLIVGRRGDIGRCALVTEKEDGFICGTGSLYIRFNSKINPIYALKTFSSKSMVLKLQEKAKGATMLNINAGSVGSLPFPIPPLKLQNKFIQKIESIEKQKKLISKSIDDVQQLFDYTMDKYFN